MHFKLLCAFAFDTLFSKMNWKPDSMQHERTSIYALRTAKLSISNIAKQLSRSRAAIRRYVKDSKMYATNHGSKKNSKLLLQDRRNITIHGKKYAVSTDIV